MDCSYEGTLCAPNLVGLKPQNLPQKNQGFFGGGSEVLDLRGFRNRGFIRHLRPFILF